MARYPTYEEYEARGNFKDGLKRCDDLLKKNPNDVQLLTVKLQLLYATQSTSSAQEVLDQLLAIQPPISDPREIVAIEEAVVDSQNAEFPPPKTAGPSVQKLWENAAKASNAVNYRLDLQSLRFSRAIINTRLQDAQQALIQLKALQPKNRVFYMAHAAVTQLLSTQKGSMEERLALSLAKKAVAEKFDQDQGLDVRVPGQIFAVQGMEKDVEGVRGTRFGESKQVFEALREGKEREVNGSAEVKERVAADAPPAERLLVEVETLKQEFRELIEAKGDASSFTDFAELSTRLFWTAAKSLPNDRKRVIPDSCFLAISALIKTYELTNQPHNLLQAAYQGEVLLSQNPHIHEARMILVYLYIRLNLGSLALRMWHSLSIKEIQHDTVGHALFTRLSLTHPMPTKLSNAGKKHIEPIERLTHALGVYVRHEDKLAESSANVLSHGQTGMLFDLESLRHSLVSSLTRRIIYLDRLRTSRLLNSTLKDKDEIAKTMPRTTAAWLAYTDTRDFSATFEYGYNVEKALYGPAIGRKWLLSRLVVEQAHALARPTSAQRTSLPVVDTQTLVSEFETTGTEIESLSLDGGAGLGGELKGSEYLAADLACQVIGLFEDLDANPDQVPNDVTRLNKGVDRLNIETLLKSESKLGEDISECLLYLDILSLVIKACHKLQANPTNQTIDTKALVDRCKGLQTDIIAHAKEKTKVVSEKEVSQAVSADMTIFEGILSFGKEVMEGWRRDVVESAKEGWEGVTKVGLGMK